MRAGFNWEFGPFEMWDAAGVVSSVNRMKALGLPVSPRVEAMLAGGHTSWYSQDGRECFNPLTGNPEPGAAIAGHARVADFRRTQRVVRGN